MYSTGVYRSLRHLRGNFEAWNTTFIGCIPLVLITAKKIPIKKKLSYNYPHTSLNVTTEEGTKNTARSSLQFSQGEFLGNICKPLCLHQISSPDIIILLLVGPKQGRIYIILKNLEIWILISTSKEDHNTYQCTQAESNITTKNIKYHQHVSSKMIWGIRGRKGSKVGRGQHTSTHVSSSTSPYLVHVHKNWCIIGC